MFLEVIVKGGRDTKNCISLATSDNINMVDKLGGRQDPFYLWSKNMAEIGDFRSILVPTSAEGHICSMAG